MVNFFLAELVLCDSKFVINNRTTAENIEAGIRDLIINKYSTNNGYTHFQMRCDINPGIYTYVEICYKKNVMLFMNIYPQYDSENPCENVYPMDNKEALMRIRKWGYENHFFVNNYCSCGKILFFEGSSDVLFPPHIRFQFDNV